MKIAKITNQIEEGKAFIVENPVNIKYLTGRNIDDGFLILTNRGGYLLVDDRYLLDVNKIDNVEVMRVYNFKNQVKDLFDSLKIKNVFLETEYVSIKRYKYYSEIFNKQKIEKIDSLDQRINSLRKIKTRDEIKKIKSAQEITDAGYSYIVDYIKPGMTEKEVSIELERELLRLGSEGKPFEFIVVSGKRTAIPHGKPTNKEIKMGELVTFDFGAKIEGYCSDMTRTISIGPMNGKQKEVYNIVLEAQKLAIKEIRAGVKGRKIDKIARDYITDKKYGKYFIHSLGHGVGLDIHEYPRLSEKSEELVIAGTVVTVEPGIYIPDEFGVRIEDMILVEDGNIKNLTMSNK